jgi:hypothetical protein
MLQPTSPQPSLEATAAIVVPEIVMALADSDKSSDSNDGSKHDDPLASTTVAEIAPAAAATGGGEVDPCSTGITSDDLPPPLASSISNPINDQVDESSSPTVMENILAASPVLSATTTTSNVASSSAEKPPPSSTIKKKATATKSKKVIKDADEKIRKKQPKAKKTNLSMDGPTAEADAVGSQQHPPLGQKKMARKKTSMNKVCVTLCVLLSIDLSFTHFNLCHLQNDNAHYFSYIILRKNLPKEKINLQ